MDIKLVILDTMAHFNEQPLLEINLRNLKIDMNSLYSILWTKDHENNKVLSDHCDETPGEHSCH